VAVKVLISSVGSGVGYGVVRALRMSDQAFHIIGLNSQALSAGVYGCDTAYLVPVLTNTEAYLQALFEVVKKEQPVLIIPGRDAELPILAQVRNELQQYGAFLMVGSEAAVSICIDKYLAAQQLSAAGLPFVPTARSYSEISFLVEQSGITLINKPTSG
jgi:carbamoyl-phosphate synthase large subunit